ncbi:unannotated protein [freshwater metagenome]|uniref:Unannotated protein n=1 Tax=freshwater metagenome TaxID=449393 RepID=A0A6J6W805_9ZZZZ
MEETKNLALHEHVGAHRDNLLLQRTDEFQTGAVTDVGQTGVAVTTEVTLQDLAVLGAVKESAPLLELPDAVR